MSSSIPARHGRRSGAAWAGSLLAVLGLAAALCLGTGTRAQAAEQVRASDAAPLAAVSDCTALGRFDAAGVKDAPARITAATVLATRVGQFCRVTGIIQPAVGFEVDLPVARWSGRYLQLGCGGLCGEVSLHLGNAAGCKPADDGTLVIATDDMGHEARPGTPGEVAFGQDPQARIDFAYRGNHVTALLAKALIARFYRAAPTHSYFLGCSDGGREALEEAARYPADFDGIAAGAPAMNFQVQNSFYHAWMAVANTGKDGTAILRADRLPILHRAVLAACDGLDGAKDGLLSDPRVCRFDPGTAQCRPGAGTNDCLTAAEVAVARKLYAGPVDEQGRHLTNGGPQFGSELSWTGVFVPPPGSNMVISRMIASGAIGGVIYPTLAPGDADLSHFAFTAANFDRVAALHALNDAGDPDITAFVRRGGRLILYHGWSDPHISPINTVSYFQALGGALGQATRDRAVRLFLFPGMYHCGGGDGFGQFNLLTPLFGWIEHATTPDSILADATVPADDAQGPGGPAAAPGPMGKPAGMPAGGPPTAPGARPAGPHRPPSSPLPVADAPSRAQRPIYAFPQLPRYSGHGDINDAANWSAGPPLVSPTLVNQWAGAASFYQPGFLRWYAAQDGRLVQLPHH